MTVEEYPVPGPYAITAGPDAALWFTLNQANPLGRITTDGTVDLHDLPTAGAAPVGLADDGAVWVALEIGTVARISS